MRIHFQSNFWLEVYDKGRGQIIDMFVKGLPGKHKLDSESTPKAT